MSFLIQLPPDELQQLLINLGIVESPARFLLSEVISPVSIVDSRISLNAEQIAPDWDTRSTEGEKTTPLANTRHLDTGQLAQGTYQFRIQMSAGSAVAFRVKQRNAADGADVNSFLVQLVDPKSYFMDVIFHIGLNERVVCENVAQPASGLTQVVAWYKIL